MELEKILGPSRDGEWVDDADSTSLREEEEEDEAKEISSGSDRQSMFYYPGSTLKNLKPLWLYLHVQNIKFLTLFKVTTH